MNDLDRAIAIIKESRQTHVNWADWRRKGNGTDTDHEMIGDLEWHENAIRDYDHVLAVLRAAPRAEGLQACPNRLYDNETGGGHPCHLPLGHDGDHDFGGPQAAAPRAEGLERAMRIFDEDWRQYTSIPLLPEDSRDVPWPIRNLIRRVREAASRPSDERVPKP